MPYSNGSQQGQTKLAQTFSRNRFAYHIVVLKKIAQLLHFFKIKL